MASSRQTKDEPELPATAMDRIGFALDGLVELFAPATGAIRRVNRQNAIVARSATLYAAADTRPGTMSWGTHAGSANQIIGASSTTVRERVYQLIRDMPLFQTALDNIADYVVGQGHMFQSQVIDEHTGHADQATRRLIEAFLSRAAEPQTADYAKDQTWHELQRMAVKQEVPNGEFLWTWEQRPDASRYIPLSVNFVEPYRLTTGFAQQVVASSTIRQGIEFDPMSGAAIAYYIAPPDTNDAAWMQDARRFDRQFVQHRFVKDRPGQLRGISRLAAFILMAHYLADMTVSEVEAGAMQSKWLAFIKTPSVETFQAMRQAQGGGPGIKDSDLFQGKKIEQLSGGIIEYLRTGEEVEFSAPSRPSETLPNFSKFAYQQFAALCHLPYEVVSGDYSQLSYSTTRTGRNDLLHALKPRWYRHRVHCCTPWQQRAMDMGVLTGVLNLRNYWAPGGREHYQDGVWIPPGLAPVDPLKEMKAVVDGIQAKLMSPQEWILSTGRDPETVIQNIADWKDLLAEHGMTMDDALPSTAMASNPAAVGKQKAAALLGGSRMLDDIQKRVDDLCLEYGLDREDLAYFIPDLIPEETTHAA